jgi:hypothetical protein
MSAPALLGLLNGLLSRLDVLVLCLLLAVVADGTTGGSTHHAMVSRHMAGDTTDGSTFDAAFCVRS